MRILAFWACYAVGKQKPGFLLLCISFVCVSTVVEQSGVSASRVEQRVGSSTPAKGKAQETQNNELMVKCC